MKVLLLNIDSKLPNLALRKLEMWHRQQGDNVTSDLIHFYSADKVYGSCILTRNKERNSSNRKQSFVSDFLKLRSDIVMGGTGYDLSVKLPPEVEAIKPKINYGFTTRGCIRNCPFCFVPKAEGNIRIVGDVYDLWDHQSRTITLLDNNILAVPEHFEKICSQLIKEGLSVDFNQGLDIRLLTPKVCELLATIKIKSEIRFAFDYPELEDIVRDKIALLRQYRIRQHPFLYVLVGFNTTFEQDKHRLEVLKELDCRAYVQRHENTPKEKRYIRLAQWANQFWTFAKYDFETFCVVYEAEKYRRATVRCLNS